MQISIAYYIQGKFPDSIKYAEKAFEIAPTLLEAGFTLAKSLAASGQNDKAAKILKPVIQQDEKYSIRTLNDRDLATKPEILQMNEELRLEEKNNSLTLLEKSSQLKEQAINEWKIMESSLSNDFNELCKNIETAVGFMDKNNYLSYLKAKKYFYQFISKRRSSIIELRKQELALEIDKMASVVLFFINNKKQNEYATSISQYLALNESELNNVGNRLRTIENGFDPKSDSFETFERCIDQLKELQREIKNIQARGETEQYRLQRLEDTRQKRLRKNAASTKYAETWASIGATLGGIVIGCNGCTSCLNHHFQVGEFPITSFNLITGVIIGAIGGAVIGAVIGAISGQMTD